MLYTSDILPLSNSATAFLSPTTRTRETVTTDAPNVPITATLYSADRSLKTSEFELTSMIGTLTESEVTEEPDDASIGKVGITLNLLRKAQLVYVIKIADYS